MLTPLAEENMEPDLSQINLSALHLLISVTFPWDSQPLHRNTSFPLSVGTGCRKETQCLSVSCCLSHLLRWAFSGHHSSYEGKKKGSWLAVDPSNITPFTLT